ncbi:hypothetical protein FCM35_KLT18575 [Carex littledalei]|uniref:Uncharacterized protein n=1 Tax=Carex littledalei TaxID=544730 RepID=A0A833RM28_9POAL|nr:hypothetical protein FCM35_KLT18575 [Carex littledalei]
MNRATHTIKQVFIVHTLSSCEVTDLGASSCRFAMRSLLLIFPKQESQEIKTRSAKLDPIRWKEAAAKRKGSAWPAQRRLSQATEERKTERGWCAGASQQASGDMARRCRAAVSVAGGGASSNERERE